MHSQSETSSRIKEKGGDCVLPAKGSQGVHPILFGPTGCRWSKAEANAELAANAAWKTTADAKSSIGGIAAPQSIDQEARDAAGYPMVLEPRVAKDREFGSLVGAFSQGAQAWACRAVSDRQTDENSQCCDCNENAGDPYADLPSQADDFAVRRVGISLRRVGISLRRVGISLRHVGPEPFEGGVVFRHSGVEPVQSAFILRLMCVHLFPQRRQFLGNLVYRRHAHCPIPVARSSSGAHRAGRRIAEPFGANGRFTFPHLISLGADRHPFLFRKGSARKTTTCAAFSSSDRSSRGPSVRSKPVRNFSWSSNRGVPFLSVKRLRREWPAIRESQASASLRRGIRRRAERRPAFDLPRLPDPNKWDAPRSARWLNLRQTLGRGQPAHRERHDACYPDVLCKP